MTAREMETFNWRSQLTPGRVFTRLAIAALLVAAGYVMGKVGESNPTFAPATPAVQMTSGDATAIKDQILAKQVVVTSNAHAIGFHDRVHTSDEDRALTNVGRAILLKDAIYRR